MKPSDANADVLIVDDEAEVRKLLVEYFGRHGMHAEAAPDAAVAREKTAAAAPKVAIVDIHMPGEDGLSLARWLHERYPRMGIVFLTADGDPVDRVVGLELGGDDYVGKPFLPRELLARVRSLLRRMARADSASAAALSNEAAIVTRRILFGDCVLDLDMRKLLSADGADIPITAAEFDLLALFARSPNRPLSRDQIMACAHNRDREAFDRSIDLRVMRLRRKLERNPDKPEIIKTVRNVGYVFVATTPKG